MSIALRFIRQRTSHWDGPSPLTHLISLSPCLKFILHSADPVQSYSVALETIELFSSSLPPILSSYLIIVFIYTYQMKEIQ